MPHTALAQICPSEPGRTTRATRAHLIGAAGCGMRSLATVLQAAGWQVTGSDVDARAIAAGHLRLYVGHDADVIEPGIDLVVHSEAVPADNPELQQARALGIETLSYPQALGRLMESRNGVAISGTHGKSTTTAMAAEILTAAGLDPTIVLGAAPIGGRSGGHLGHSRWMLAEACEFRRSFHHLRPEMAVVLNVEHDHVDCYPTPQDVERAFAQFAAQVPADGLVLANAECPATVRTIAEVQASCETFGLTPAAAWHADQLRERRGYYSFHLRHRQRLVCEVKLHVPGRHNVQNALAAAAVASHCGATGSAIKAGLERFAGLRRRLQLLGEVRQIALLDDYAHHPTAVTATLATVRQMYPGRQLWCVFQPHQVSRTAALLDEFARSLHNADKLVVTDIYRARETHDEAGLVTAADLRARLVERGASLVAPPPGVGLLEYLKGQLRPQDVLVTIGAGDIGTIAHEFGQGLRTFRQAG